MTEQKVTLIAVTDDNRKIICVYLNGYRVAGRKPWVADNSIWREIEISKRDILAAIGEIDVCRNVKHTWVDGMCAQCGKEHK